MKLKKDKMKNWKAPNKFFILFCLIMLILYFQYCYLSLSKKIYGIDMKEFASNRNTVNVTLLAKRGTIYDIKGNTLALNTTSYTMIAYLDSSRTKDITNPKHVVDKEYTATKLSQVMGADYDYILNRLNTDAYQVEFGTIGRNITELMKLSIQELNLPGIDFIETTNRFYPNGNFASYIVGYAKNNDDGEIEGKLGIESKYDDILKGTDGYYEYQQDKMGYKIPDTPERREEAINGSNIYLTIDSSIQRFTESAVKDITLANNPEWVTISVMNAKTGEILASGSNPSFDPNNIPKDMKYQNPLVSYTFEPGSTMKIYTYMCAIEKGVYNGSDTFLSGTYKVGPNTINDWNNGAGWGYISYDSGFERSSNVGVANIITNYLSKDELQDCLMKYGFGDKTGIELSSEAKGSLNFKYDIEVLAAGYGQGISTTPIQHLQALSIIANDGYMVKPHIISKIVDNNGEETITKIDKSKRVSSDTVNKIKELMRSVIVGENGTGTRYDIEGYDIIGKTGTAQIYENGKYLNGEYILSVALMYPYDDPEIIIYAAVKKPPENSTKVLAEPIKELMENIAKYLNMFGSTNTLSSVKTYKLESYLNKNTDDVKSELEQNDINVIVIGDGDKIINQYPKENIKILSHDYVIIYTDGENKIMPNMTNWSRNLVNAYCNMIGNNCSINGTGYVVSQNIEENSVIDGDIIVDLKDK